MQLLRHLRAIFFIVQQTAITYRSVADSKHDMLLVRELSKQDVLLVRELATSLV
jgi:hypothetical protein